MNRTLVCGVILFLVAAIILYSRKPDTSVTWVELSGHRYEVEVARTREELEQGLMFRKHMPQKYGMLFVFSQEMTLGFWMKNTLIPLDILYFDRNGILVDQKRNAPSCIQDPCHMYFSSTPTQYVLELNAGQADVIDLKTGQRLHFAPGLLSP